MATISVLNTTSDLSGKTLVTAEGDRTVTGLLSYSRGGGAPFAVNVGAGMVANLDADKLDGLDSTIFTRNDGGANTGGQIKFPAVQVPSTDVNTLDDYEEGTWTPVIGGISGTSGQTYSVQFGTYVKIGKLVTAQFAATLSALGTVTGVVQIQGLPFTIESTANYQPPLVIGYWTGMTTALVWAGGIGIIGTTAATLGALGAAAASVGNLGTANLSNTTQFIGSITYRATA